MSKKILKSYTLKELKDCKRLIGRLFKKSVENMTEIYSSLFLLQMELKLRKNKEYSKKFKENKFRK